MCQDSPSRCKANSARPPSSRGSVHSRAVPAASSTSPPAHRNLPGPKSLEKVYQARHTYQLFEDSIPTLEALRGKYKLGVISDTWPSIVPVLEEFGLPGYFDTLTYSFEVGCFKPDPRMFADALGKMGLPPEQCVFIDDTAQNLVGAQKLGIQPVQIRKKPGADPCPEGMLSIDKISGILELLP